MAEKIFNGIFIFITAIAIVINGFWLYYFVFQGDKGFETNITTIAKDMTKIEKEDETKTFPIEVNYFSNEERNGFEMLEVKINSYTSHEMTSYHSYGLQLINPVWAMQEYRVPGSSFFNQRLVKAYRPNVKSYNTSNGISYQATNSISREDQVIFDINGEAFALKVKSNFNDYNDMEEVCKKLVMYDQKLMTKYYYDYDWAMLVKQLHGIAKTINYGDYEIGLVDLSEFVAMEKYDEAYKKFMPLDNFDNYKNFFKIKIHCDKNGVTSCEQSLFKMINYNPYYFNQNTDTDYWKAVAEYVIEEECFNKRTTELGSFLTIKQEVLERLNKYQNIEIVVSLNLDENNIAGIDTYGLYGFNVKELRLNSAIKKDFYLLSNSITNSKLEVITRDGNINLKIADNSGFTGVIE